MGQVGAERFNSLTRKVADMVRDWEDSPELHEEFSERLIGVILSEVMLRQDFRERAEKNGKPENLFLEGRKAL